MAANDPAERRPADPAAARARLWQYVAVNEAESHVAALHRDHLLAGRRAAMERLAEAQRVVSYVKELGDDEALRAAVEGLGRASREYKRVRDDVAAELQCIIRARVTRMAEMAEQLGEAAGGSWPYGVDFGDGRA